MAVPEPRHADLAATEEGPTARERICDAARDLVLEHGYGTPTVEMVVERAGVDRAEFDRHFADLEDCCLQIYIENIEDFDEVVFGAFDRPGSWRDRLRAAAYALARFLRDRPPDVRFDVVEMSSAGPVPRVHRERQLQRMVDLVDLGRQELDDPDSLNRSAAESVVGAIYALIVGELQAGRADAAAAESIVPDVMFVALRPYLGHAVAIEEFEIPPPPEPPRPGRERGPVPVRTSEPGPVLRERVREAVIDLVLANGFEAVSATMVAERAGIGLALFERHFGDLQSCCLRVYDENGAAFEREVLPAFEGPGEWRVRVRAVIYATARFVREHPRRAAFGLVHIPGAGEVAQAYRERLLQRMVDLVDLGRQELDDPDSVSREVAERIVGTIYARVFQDVQDPWSMSALEDRVPALMCLVVRPYLGDAEALEELTIPPPPQGPEGGG